MSIMIELPDTFISNVTDAVLTELRLRKIWPTNQPDPQVNAAEPDAHAIYAIYDNYRIDAWYFPESRSVEIYSGPPEVIRPQRQRLSVSGSAMSVIRALNPNKDPHRNGWSFWKLLATDEPLQSIRFAY